MRTALDFLIIAMVYVAPASFFLWGWARWLRRRPDAPFSLASFLSFLFGSAALLLGVFTLLYAQAIGGFRYYDSRLVVIYRISAVLCLLAVLFAVRGIWQRSALRWLAPALALSTFVLWFTWALGE